MEGVGECQTEVENTTPIGKEGRKSLPLDQAPSRGKEANNRKKQRKEVVAFFHVFSETGRKMGLSCEYSLGHLEDRNQVTKNGVEESSKGSSIKSKGEGERSLFRSVFRAIVRTLKTNRGRGREKVGGH